MTMSASARPDAMLLHPANGRRQTGQVISDVHTVTAPPASAEAVTDPLAVERLRLEAALADAKARAEAARGRLRALEEASRQAMRDEVAAVRRRITELDAQHREALAAIEVAAEHHIATIRSGAGVPEGRADESCVDGVADAD